MAQSGTTQRNKHVYDLFFFTVSSDLVNAQHVKDGALRFPQGKVPCGIPQGHGFFPLWDFSKIENLSLKFREMLVGWIGRRL